jgi:hypothetical protein
MRKLIVHQWVTVDNIAAEEDGGLSFVSGVRRGPNLHLTWAAILGSPPAALGRFCAAQ